MHLHSVIIDDFFEINWFNDIKRLLAKSEFKGEVSPEDGVLYPGIAICDKIVTEQVLKQLQSFFPDHPISVNQTFFRLSVWGELAPHQAHTDKIMGEYTLIVYLSEPHPKVFCGTTILEHASGQMPMHPTTPHGEAVWTRDTNNPGMWTVVGQCPQKLNRGFLLRSDLFHRSEPIGGYGNDKADGRIVLVCFFDVTS